MTVETPITFSALAPVMGGGFVVALLHTALPTHWLPFVLAARARKWRLGQTLAVSAIAALAHVLSTAILGAVLTGVGQLAHARLGNLFDRLAGAALMAIGGWMIVQAVRHHMGLPHWGHGHTAHGAARRPQDMVSDRGAIIGLVVLLLFAPCEAFLPVYLTQARLGWAGFSLLTMALAAGTLIGMLGFVSLSSAGVARLRSERLETWEGAAIGVTLAGLGLLALVVG